MKTNPNKKSKLPSNTVLSRKGLERLDLLLLVTETLDVNSSESLIITSRQIGLQTFFPNRVELWKLRCHNPLRRSTRRGSLKSNQTDALIALYVPG